MVYYALAVTVVYSMLSWVRNLARFSFTFIVGNLLIVVAVIYVTIYAGQVLKEQGGHGPNIMFMNDAGVINTLGFSIYCYEGIGIVMPVMATSAEPEKFKAMLSYAFLTLITIFVAFMCFTYVVWGSNLTEPIVT